MSTLRTNTIETLDGESILVVGDIQRKVSAVVNLSGVAAVNGAVVEVQGYYVPGDGGGGTYRLDKTSVLTGNGGSIVASAFGGKWLLVNRSRVTPAQFGAKGDWNGTTGTDDWNAFQNLSSHLSMFGGTVHISKRHLVGGGWLCDAANYTVNGTGVAEIHSYGNLNQHTFSANNTSGVVLEGVKFSQPRTLLRRNEFAVCFTDCTDCKVIRCKTDGGTAGIWTTHCTYMLVEGCLVDTPKADGIHFSHGSSYCKAINNTVLNAGDDSYASTYYYASSGRPTDNQFIGNKARGGVWGFGCAIYSGDNMLIQGNDFRDCALGGIQITTNADGTNCTNIDAKDNVIIGACRVNVVPNMYWYGTADEAVVSPLHKTAVSISGTKVSVTGTTITGVTSPASGAATRTGCLMNGGSLITFSKNILNSISGLGVDGGTGQVSQVNVHDNEFDSVNDVSISFKNTPLLNSLSICGNKSGIGAFAGTAHMVYLSGAGAVRTMICNNTSSGGRGVYVGPECTNVLATNNNA